jgi:predicted metalloprotease with PDZ domain
LEVGDAKLENVPATVMDHPYIDAMSQAFGPVYGIVGFPFFARYKMTIDYQAMKLTMTPSGFEPTDANEQIIGMIMGGDKGPKVISPAGQWGFAVEKPTSDKDKDAGVVVKSVIKDSPAAVGGLKAGDRLLTLDDRWTDTVLDTYLAASLAKPGTEVKVKVKRDGKDMELTVKPVSGL